MPDSNMEKQPALSDQKQKKEKAPMYEIVGKDGIVHRAANYDELLKIVEDLREGEK